jgi:hypothetical protein
VGAKMLVFKQEDMQEEVAEDIFVSNNERAMDSIPTILPSTRHLIPTQAGG